MGSSLTLAVAARWCACWIDDGTIEAAADMLRPASGALGGMGRTVTPDVRDHHRRLRWPELRGIRP
jgi:hypothetical protein